jgi:hypothetical protein
MADKKFDNKLDPETAQSLHEGMELRHMTESEGWGIAKAMLMGKVAMLDSVSSLPNDITLEEIGKQAMFRAHAISLVMDWINDIEGKLEQTQQQTDTLVINREEEIIRFH